MNARGSAVADAAAPGTGLAQTTLRRLIQYGLLFALVVIAASGLSGLLERLFGSGTVLAARDGAGLALSLTFTLIGGPLALLLWWFVWKRIDDDEERTSAAWGLYLTAMYAVALLIAATSLLGLAASLIGRPDNRWAGALATGLVWAVIWAWHRWMWRHPSRPTSHLEDVRAVVGFVFGLLVAAVAGAAALSELFDAALRGAALTAAVEPWWHSVLRSLVWAAGGAVVWWWHWFHEDGRRFRTGLVDSVMIIVGVFAAGLAALAGTGVAVFVLLRLAFDRDDPLQELLEPMPEALAAALVGALIWRYHRLASARRSRESRRAGLLVTSGVALAAAASGVGVIINALLAAAASPLAGGGTRTLLLGGISSLLVGGPVWWLAWKPRKQPLSVEAIQPGRRVYLVVFFGVSAVVALIVLLLIGYRLFEFLLGDISGGSLIDRLRTQLGLLVAAGLVAGYHFALWRHDRALLAAAAPVRRRTVEQVILVTPPGGTAGYADALARGIADATGGAKVTTWLRADGGQSDESAPAAPGAGDGERADPVGQEANRQETVREVAAALDAVAARHVLVILGPAARLEVVPLAVPNPARG